MKATKEQAFKAGRDCAEKGANTTNCHFTLFANSELTKEWQRGYDEAKAGGVIMAEPLKRRKS